MKLAFYTPLFLLVLVSCTLAAAHPLTITFIGQVDAGKSSLSNCLIGYKHFTVKATTTPEAEVPLVLPELTIISLPGYGLRTQRTRGYIQRHRIKASDIVIVVLKDVIQESDYEIMKELLSREGQRVLLVRNKFDLAIQSRLIEAGSPLPGSDISNNIKTSVWQEIRRNFKSEISHLKKETNKNNFQPDLIFTTCGDSYFHKGIPVLRNEIEKLLTPEEKEAWYKFSNSRLATQNTHIGIFVDLLQAALKHESGNKFEWILDELMQREGINCTEYTDKHCLLEEFNKSYNVNFDEVMSSLSFHAYTLGNIRWSRIKEALWSLGKATFRDGPATGGGIGATAGIKTAAKTPGGVVPKTVVIGVTTAIGGLVGIPLGALYGTYSSIKTYFWGDWHDFDGEQKELHYGITTLSNYMMRFFCQKVLQEKKDRLWMSEYAAQHVYDQIPPIGISAKEHQTTSHQPSVQPGTSPQPPAKPLRSKAESLREQPYMEAIFTSHRNNAVI